MNTSTAAGWNVVETSETFACVELENVIGCASNTVTINIIEYAICYVSDTYLIVVLVDQHKTTLALTTVVLTDQA